MRRSLILLPLLLVGCKAGRQAAVSNDGRVASTAEGGTYVAGVGRVGPSAQALAWSPDGSTLAYTTRGQVRLWPGARRIVGLGSPMAWSPDGRALAAVRGSRVVVRDLGTGRERATTLQGDIKGLRWAAGVGLVGLGTRSLAIDGGPTANLGTSRPLDVVAGPDGRLTFIAFNEDPKTLADLPGLTLLRGEWTPGGAVKTVLISRLDALLPTERPDQRDVPLGFRLSSGGGTVAVDALRIEAAPSRLERLETILRKGETMSMDDREAKSILDAARLSSSVVGINAAGRTRTLWKGSSLHESGPTDLAWSPDGRWLAVARNAGTVRVRAE